MDINKVVAVKRLNQPITEAKSLSQPVQQSEIDQPEQPKSVGRLEPLAEPPKDESVYGSGWSLAQLMDEFSGQ